MIFGAHVIVCSKDAEADRAFFRDILGFKSIDAGHDGSFLPCLPRKPRFIPTRSPSRMIGMNCISCVTISRLRSPRSKKKGVACSDIQNERWGSITRIKLPGGGRIGLYQPKHPIALASN